ncbi:putative mechanosensitive small-conductance channel MscC [Desulforapulum autotrophicum HRM2]|uniref:Mechanosensitive small-conductance channel MscC n=1 Tax=Desulforapulum autotrophicum (strain ATCC 43914 / DSM 3382 / VKM B-1955 / HRM2) TaxID=177437 RepID=C0QM93_DESAH|nr:mechanosensitive ion channel family protein [Desulforapulum autotrophicum]ACN16410.1 putative mechanosensitive small-conductance channel MscC [Desulforapulum autotrophicum HRM2]
MMPVLPVFFTKLRQLLKNSIWFLVILYAAHSLFLPPTVNNALFVTFKIYLIIAIGFLVVRAATATVDSLEALSKKYWYRESYLDWYNRFSELMPLLRRCLEYIIYAWAASLVMLQVNFIAQFASFGPSFVQIIGIFFIARMVVEVVNLLVDKYMLPTDEIAGSPNKQQQTLVPIIKTLLQYGIYFIAFVLMLRAVDINPLPLLAGAGVLGIVVGLGAQSLINDLVSGFFILFEGLFLVDDYIETASARGIVEAIHIRTTMVRDPNGQLHILRNGQINSVVNYSKDYTYAVVEVGVAYDSDLDHVFRVLSDTGLQLKEKNLNVLEPLEVKGIKEFGESELLIRTLTKVRPSCHLRVAFELREMIKKTFDQEGIEIPFPRRVILSQNGINNQSETTSPRIHDPKAGTLLRSQCLLPRCMVEGFKYIIFWIVVSIDPANFANPRKLS